MKLLRLLPWNRESFVTRVWIGPAVMIIRPRSKTKRPADRIQSEMGI